jgi:hypothetical protein
MQAQRMTNDMAPGLHDFKHVLGPERERKNDASTDVRQQLAPFLTEGSVR